jgi:DNA-directed RNA polymerase specialized sigma24 family protein
MDVMQDTLLKLFSSIRNFRGASRLDGWLYRMVVNRCLDHHRGARRFIPMAGDFVGALRARADSVADLLNAERQTVCVRQWTASRHLCALQSRCGIGAGSPTTR